MRRVVIACTLGDRIGDLVNRLRWQHDRRTAEAICGHVTLAGPVNTERSVEAILEVLRPLSSTLSPFGFDVGGVGTFLPVSCVCYLAVPQVPEIMGLNKEILSALGWREQYPYAPHITITEYLDADRTAAVAADIGGLDWAEAAPVVVDHLAVLEKSVSGQWIEQERLRLGDS